MRTIKLILLVFGFILTHGAYASPTPTLADSGKITNLLHLSITARSGQNTNLNNQPVVLLVNLKNISNRTLHLNEPVILPVNDGTYSIEVTSPSGKNVGPSDLSLYVPSIQTHSVELAPGKDISFEFDLRQYCRFDEAGNYKVKVRRIVTLPGELRKAILRSNPLDLTVVPKSDQVLSSEGEVK